MGSERNEKEMKRIIINRVLIRKKQKIERENGKEGKERRDKNGEKNETGKNKNQEKGKKMGKRERGKMEGEKTQRHIQVKEINEKSKKIK